jgi:uncharacterized protein (DUF1015 family)
MAEVHPLRGVRYNQRLIKDLDRVICPPYDIITPQTAQELYQRSEYNFVRVEATGELTQYRGQEDKYTRSASALEQWLAQGVLRIDELPAIYIHDHHFVHLGRQFKRRGIILRVRLEEWDSMTVRPHEGTLSEPKADRLSLLRALQANTSPILALFEDQGRSVSSVLAEQERNEPVIHSNGFGGERHDVWAITEPESIARICQSLASQPLYIADGHHRYESALAYRRERHACSTSQSGNEPFNFVMMTLVDFFDPGLIILPPHRLIRGMSKSTLDAVMDSLKVFFDVEELPLSMPGVWQQVDDLLTSETEQVTIALFGLVLESLLVLRLSDFATASRVMSRFHSELYKRLQVSIVDHIILEKVLEISGEREKVALGYSHTREEAVNRVLDKEYQLAILVSPVRAETVKTIADVGDRMPRKSTYFFPKAPAGLALYRLA